MDISDYENAIEQINGQIATLEALRNTPFESFKNLVDNASSIVEEEEKKKLVEEYIAAIDEYYAALKRLESVQLRLAEIESKIENSNSDDDKIAFTKQLIAVYNEESDALKNLNELRSNTIKNGIEELKSLGFQVQYNVETNELYVSNLEHLNDLQATSVGQYDSLQEATNELRKRTEDLINTLDSLSTSNQEGAASIREIQSSRSERSNDCFRIVRAVIDHRQQNTINLQFRIDLSPNL